MALFTNSSFRNTSVLLDGHEYQNCIFENCLLEIRATDVFSLIGCTFKACQWSFTGPAANTFQVLKGLYHGMGPDGAKLVEDIFNSVRRNDSVNTSSTLSTSASSLSTSEKLQPLNPQKRRRK